VEKKTRSWRMLGVSYIISTTSFMCGEITGGEIVPLIHLA